MDLTATLPFSLQPSRLSCTFWTYQASTICPRELLKINFSLSFCVYIYVCVCTHTLFLWRILTKERRNLSLLTANRLSVKANQLIHTYFNVLKLKKFGLDHKLYHKNKYCMCFLSGPFFLKQPHTHAFITNFSTTRVSELLNLYFPPWMITPVTDLLLCES